MKTSTALMGVMLIPALLALLPLDAVRADQDSERWLRDAARGGGRVAEVRALLAQGVDPNAPDARGRSAVHFAAANRVEALRLVLEAGGECCVPDGDGNTPLHHAAASVSFGEGDVLARVRLLIEAGADSDWPNEHGNTPLHVAAKQDSTAIVDALLSDGADPNRANALGDTPLHTAIRPIPIHVGMGGPGANSLDVVRTLLRGGAAVDATDGEGMTSLQILAGDEVESVTTMTVLLAGGADPNRRGRDGRPLLHVVMENTALRVGDRERYVRALLAGGADPCLANAQRYISIHVARGLQLATIEELIARAGGLDSRCDERTLADAQRDAEEAAAAEEEALGLDRETRRRIQMGLEAEGFDPGPVDGLFGPRTRSAIRGWQEAQGRAVTGYLDEVSAKALLAAGERFEDVPESEDALDGKTETAEVVVSGEEAAETEHASEAETSSAVDSAERDEKAKEVYDHAVRIHTVKAYEAVRNEFPDTVYADLADAQIEKLKMSGGGDSLDSIPPGTSVREDTTSSASNTGNELRLDGRWQNNDSNWFGFRYTNIWIIRTDGNKIIIDQEEPDPISGEVRWSGTIVGNRVTLHTDNDMAETLEATIVDANTIKYTWSYGKGTAKRIQASED